MLRKKRVYFYSVLVVLMGLEPTALSSFPNSGFHNTELKHGVYKLSQKLCENKQDSSINPTRFPIHLVVSAKSSYFYQRIDSSCRYIQPIKIRGINTDSSNINFKKSYSRGECHFAPKNLIFADKVNDRAQIIESKNKLNITWIDNPSLQDCAGNTVTWVLEKKN